MVFLLGLQPVAAYFEEIAYMHTLHRFLPGCLYMVFNIDRDICCYDSRNLVGKGRGCQYSSNLITTTCAHLIYLTGLQLSSSRAIESHQQLVIEIFRQIL